MQSHEPNELYDAASAADPIEHDAHEAVTTVESEEVVALREKVETLTAQLEQERNQHLRSVADFQNAKRRQESRADEVIQFANRELILGLLPVLDNFERALAASAKNQSYEALVGGVSATHRQLQDYLKKNGVETIESLGKPFDPAQHEAVMRVESEEHPENTVVEELQRGYVMHSRVLRPAMVKVASGE
jgi:molecular chaperone GrpE